MECSRAPGGREGGGGAPTIQVGSKSTINYLGNTEININTILNNDFFMAVSTFLLYFIKVSTNALFFIYLFKMSRY